MVLWSTLLASILLLISVVFKIGCFVYHLNALQVVYFQAANIVPSLIFFNVQALYIQHVCCSHKNVILNEK